MRIESNTDLTGFNTFGIKTVARYFARFSDAEQLGELLQAPEAAGGTLVLGGGSNMLLTKDYGGLVLKNEVAGIEVVQEDEEFVDVKAGGGENWHQLVMHCVDNGFAGMENLSLIPGSVGASPMQNIGAYGVEIRDIFSSLEAYDKTERTVRSFGLAECEFGYRESIFKRRHRDRFVILNVTFRLRKQPRFNTSYGAINAELERMGVQELSIKAVSQAVINIRSSKLPDPKEIGNAGSFFKNPTITQPAFEALLANYPSMPSFPAEHDRIKIPAGWLIEQCGWKGFREGDAGCYPKQALVLVNYGNASGIEILQLSQKIIDSVHQRFGIELEREVNII